MVHSVFSTRVFNPNLLLEEYNAVTSALETGDTSVLKTTGQKSNYEKCTDFKKNGTASCTGNYMLMGYENGTYKQAKKMLDDGDYIKNILWAVTPETLMSSGSTLEDILTEGFTKIIIGDKPIDYFDTVVNNWQSAGGKQATEEMNKIYK